MVLFTHSLNCNSEQGRSDATERAWKNLFYLGGDMRSRIAMFLLVAVASAGACSQSFPEWKRGRSFIVRVTVDGAPFAGMRVVLEPEDETLKSEQRETISNSTGTARFSHIKPGRYYVEAQRLGVGTGPGTVIVGKRGSSEPIGVEWPMRGAYTVTTLDGRFEWKPFTALLKTEPPPSSSAPLSNAKLTLNRIDSEKEIASVVTDLNGSFSFPAVEPGAYLLHIQETGPDQKSSGPDDYLVIHVDPNSGRSYLNLGLVWTSCGLMTTELE